MVRHNIRMFAFAILWMAFLVYGTIFWFTQNLESVDWNKAVSHISTTITINIIIWTIFITWLWKWRIFYPWLVQTPDLSGEWHGEIKSNWGDKKNISIPVTVKIVQTFFNIQVKIKTNESESYSIGATFDIDGDRGFQRLFYSYLNTPKSGFREASAIHYGSTLLNFNGFKVIEMEGEYWTSRETTGEIHLKKHIT